MSYRPIFVFGMARSGTNLLARMLDRHPEVTVALDPLLPLFRSWRNAIIATHAAADVRARFDPASSFHDYYFDPDGPALLNLILAADADLPLDGQELAILRNKVIERASLESPVLGSRMVNLAGPTYRRLLQGAFDTIAESKPGATWVGIKEVWILEFLPALARFFPDARFYVIERDPRAVVASLSALAERDPTQAAHIPSYLRHWRRNIALAREFKADPLLHGRLGLVSYERLAANAEIEMKHICDELEIDFTPAVLRLSADGWKGNSSYDHGGRDVYSESVDRWRRVLPEDIVQAVDFLCGPEAALTPYRTTSTPRAQDVLGYLAEANTRPGSWRSDRADLLVDFGGELLRYTLLGAKASADEELVKRCFLFRDTFEAIRAAGEWATVYED